MFQSFSFSNGRCIITDSDFQETVDYVTKQLVELIIEIYSRRNLNVALNIALFMQYRDKNEYGDSWSIDNQFSFYKKHIKDFDKYLPDINKYLGLL